MAHRTLWNLPSVVAGKKTKSEKDDKFKQIKVRSVFNSARACEYNLLQIFLIAPTIYCGGYLWMLVVCLSNYSYPGCLGLDLFEMWRQLKPWLTSSMDTALVLQCLEVGKPAVSAIHLPFACLCKDKYSNKGKNASEQYSYLLEQLISVCKALEINLHLGKGQSCTLCSCFVRRSLLEGLSCEALQSQSEISACSEHGPRLTLLSLWGTVFPSFHTSAKGLCKVVTITHQQELVHLQFFFFLKSKYRRFQTLSFQ